VMSHYSMPDWWSRRKGNNHIHLHGHVHTQFAQGTIGNNIRARRYDIGVDMYGGPVELTGDCRYLNAPKGWQ
jgi:hypothetical protein